jgi:hypothetical protein
MSDLLEMDEEEPKPKTWRIEVTQTLSGVIILDAKGYEIATEEEAKSYALSMLSDGDWNHWEGGGHEVQSCSAISDRCHGTTAATPWCETHDDPMRRAGHHCYDSAEWIHGRWRERVDQRRRRADREFRQTHHQTHWDMNSEPHSIDAWKCQHCDASGTDRPSRLVHEQIPLAPDQVAP